MTIFLGISGILAWLFGAALLLTPAQFYAPTGIDMTPMLATIAQAHGATLVGLGFIDWFSRRLRSQAVVGVLVGNLVTHVLSLGVVLRTMMLGAGAAVAPGVVIHVALGALFAWFLVATLRESARGRV